MPFFKKNIADAYAVAGDASDLTGGAAVESSNWFKKLDDYGFNQTGPADALREVADRGRGTEGILIAASYHGGNTARAFVLKNISDHVVVTDLAEGHAYLARQRTDDQGRSRLSWDGDRGIVPRMAYFRSTTPKPKGQREIDRARLLDARRLVSLFPGASVAFEATCRDSFYSSSDEPGERRILRLHSDGRIARELTRQEQVTAHANGVLSHYRRIAFRESDMSLHKLRSMSLEADRPRPNPTTLASRPDEEPAPPYEPLPTGEEPPEYGTIVEPQSTAAPTVADMAGRRGVGVPPPPTSLGTPPAPTAAATTASASAPGADAPRMGRRAG